MFILHLPDGERLETDDVRILPSARRPHRFDIVARGSLVAANVLLRREPRDEGTHLYLALEETHVPTGGQNQNLEQPGTPELS